MTTAVQQLGDRMLAALLKTDRAGACVPEHGELCVSCAGSLAKTTECRCNPSTGAEECKYRKRVYNCNGACTQWSAYCFNGAYVGTGSFC